MRRLALLGLLAGCAHTPTLSDSLAVASVELHIASITAEVVSQAWAEAVDAQIARCKAFPLADTPKARAACMGKYGEGAALEEDFAVLRDGYDAAADNLDSMRAAAKRIETRIGDRP